MDTIFEHAFLLILGALVSLTGAAYAMRVQAKAEQRRFEFGWSAKERRQYREQRARLIEGLLLPRRDAHIEILAGLHALRPLLFAGRTSGDDFLQARLQFQRAYVLGATWLRQAALEKLQEFSRNLEGPALTPEHWRILCIEAIQRLEWSLGIEQLEAHCSDLESHATLEATTRVH